MRGNGAHKKTRCDEKECHDNGCNPLTLMWVDKMKSDMCRWRLVCREVKKAKNKGGELGPEDAFSHMPPSEGLKMLMSTMMTGHDDGNHTDKPIETALRDVSREHLYAKPFR